MTLIDATHVRSLVIRKYIMTCNECALSTSDQKIMDNHNCDIQRNGGNCEDAPCCGHEYGDCNGLKYGSDESIIEYAMEHIGCDHENGQYECGDGEDECDDEDCYVTGKCSC